VLLSRWFDKARGKAMGFAYLGIGIGGWMVLKLSPNLVAAFGWRGALQALGIVIVVVALPMAYFVRDEPDAESQTAGLDGSGRQVRALPPLGGLFKDPAFYLLALGSMCSIAAVGGANQHLKLYLSLDLKYSQADAATIASTVLFCSIFGRLLMGWLADRIPKKAVMILIYVLVAGSIPLLLRGSSMGALYGFDRVRPRPGRRIHDHPADGGRTVRRPRARPAARGHSHRRRRGRGDVADVDRLSS
jgi:sugar phosphate permease